MGRGGERDLLMEWKEKFQKKRKKKKKKKKVKKRKKERERVKNHSIQASH